MSKTSTSVLAREKTSELENSTCMSLAVRRSLAMKASQPVSAGLAAAGAGAPAIANKMKATPGRHSIALSSIRPLFVVIGDQPVEQAHAPARAPGLVDFARRRSHADAGDVEMRPGRAIDETLQELRRRYRAAMAAGGVFDVGEFGIDHLVVDGAERHPPDLLAGGDARLNEARRQFVIVGKEAGVLLAKRDQNGAGQRRQIDHESVLVFILDVPEHVGQTQPALVVGIDDLDRLARHRGEDVAGANRAAIRHV